MFWLSFGPEAAWQHARVPGMLCGGWNDCCECLCNEVVLFPIGPLNPLVGEPSYFSCWSTSRPLGSCWLLDQSAANTFPDP